MRRRAIQGPRYGNDIAHPLAAVVVVLQVAVIGLDRCGKRGLLAMAPVQDVAVWQNRLAGLPLARYGAGETVLAEGTRTGRLFILKSGAVSVVKHGIKIAIVAEPGAVFGELSALLDQPHGADVRALESCEFHVADAAQLLADPTALVYVATALARRIDGANHALLELKSQLEAGEPASLIEQTVGRIEGLLNAIGAGYIRASAGLAGHHYT